MEVQKDNKSNSEQKSRYHHNGSKNIKNESNTNTIALAQKQIRASK